MVRPAKADPDQLFIAVCESFGRCKQSHSNPCFRLQRGQKSPYITYFDEPFARRLRAAWPGNQTKAFSGNKGSNEIGNCRLPRSDSATQSASLSYGGAGILPGTGRPTQAHHQDWRRPRAPFPAPRFCPSLIFSSPPCASSTPLFLPSSTISRDHYLRPTRLLRAPGLTFVNSLNNCHSLSSSLLTPQPV